MNKILIFSYDFPPNDGGIARLCSEIAYHLKQKDYAVEVLTTNHEGINKNAYNIGGMSILHKSAKRIVAELQFFFYLLTLKNKSQYTIICGLWYPEALLTILAGCKNVYILTHAAELRPGTSLFRRKIWIKYVARWVLTKAKKVIANSEYTECLSLSVSPKARVIALPLAVNHHFFSCKKYWNTDVEHPLVLCTVARVQKFKGYDFILETIASLSQDLRERIRWVIAGDGEYKENLIKKIGEYELNHVVDFRGFIQDEHLPEIYQQSDLFILGTQEDAKTCNVEGFGLVLLEAQSCGTPVIATEVGGIPSAVKNGNGGWLIPSDGVQELSLLLKDLILNRDIIKKQGCRARYKIEQNATWEIYISKLESILKLKN